jgi:hypothetical protein
MSLMVIKHLSSGKLIIITFLTFVSLLESAEDEGDNQPQ